MRPYRQSRMPKLLLISAALGMFITGASSRPRGPRLLDMALISAGLALLGQP